MKARLHEIARAVLLAALVGLASCARPALAPPQAADLTIAPDPVVHDSAFLDAAGPSLAVRLTLEDGTVPVPGCRIAIFVESGGWIRRPVDPHASDWKLERRLLAEQVTDERGVARFGRVAAGSYVIAAGAHGERRGLCDFVTVAAGAADVECDLHVRATTDIVGRVVGPTGAGVEGYAVTLRGPLGESDWRIVARTDADGRYAFEDVLVGYVPTLCVWFGTRGSRSWYGRGQQGDGWHVIRLEPGRVDVPDFELSRGEECWTRVARGGA